MTNEFYTPSPQDNYVLYENLLFNSQKEKVTSIDGVELSDCYFYNLYDWAYKPTWVDTEKSPHMIYAGKGPILQLENKNYDQSMINHLNQQGLNIYLIEILTFSRENLTDFSYTGDISLNNLGGCMEVIDTFCGSTVITDFDSDDQIFCYELESISRFVKNNKLTNVSVYTCHYNIKKYFQDTYPEIKLFCKDLYLASNVDFPERKRIDDFSIDVINHVEYKFFSPNWRYHSARHLIMSYLINCSGRYSWYYKGNIDLLKKNLWFELDQWEEINPQIYKTINQGSAILDEKSPLVIDIETGSTNITGDIDHYKYPGNFSSAPNDWSLVDGYLKGFCVVVTESVFCQPMAIASEKTLYPIKNGKPFVLVAPPHTLEYLRRQGFKTFDRFWDESYDHETDHEKRILKILETINYINNKSLEELKVMYSNMEDIIKHNIEMLDILKTKTWIFE